MAGRAPRPSRKRDALKAQGALHPRPQDVTDPLFRESTFFDAHDIVQVKYEMLRRVRGEGRVPAGGPARLAAAFCSHSCECTSTNSRTVFSYAHETRSWSQHDRGDARTGTLPPRGEMDAPAPSPPPPPPPSCVRGQT